MLNCIDPECPTRMLEQFKYALPTLPLLPLRVVRWNQGPIQKLRKGGPITPYCAILGFLRMRTYINYTCSHGKANGKERGGPGPLGPPWIHHWEFTLRAISLTYVPSHFLLLSICPASSNYTLGVTG